MQMAATASQTEVIPHPGLASLLSVASDWLRMYRDRSGIFSYAFLETYERNGGKNTLGDTDARAGETPHVHDWVRTKDHALLYRTSGEARLVTTIHF